MPEKSLLVHNHQLSVSVLHAFETTSNIWYGSAKTAFLMPLQPIAELVNPKEILSSRKRIKDHHHLHIVKDKEQSFR